MRPPAATRARPSNVRRRSCCARSRNSSSTTRCARRRPPTSKRCATASRCARWACSVSSTRRATARPSSATSRPARAPSPRRCRPRWRRRHARRRLASRAPAVRSPTPGRPLLHRLRRAVRPRLRRVPHHQRARRALLQGLRRRPGWTGLTCPCESSRSCWRSSARWPSPKAARRAQAMPDAAQMSGMPLPAGELPNGTVTVRLVRERMGNNVPGQEVALITPDGRVTAVTDAQGRAEFTSVPPGTPVTAEATLDGETITLARVPRARHRRRARGARGGRGPGGGRRRRREGRRGQGAGAAGRGRVRQRHAHRAGVPGRQADVLLSVQRHEQRAHAGRPRQAARSSTCRPPPKARRWCRATRRSRACRIAGSR